MISFKKVFSVLLAVIMLLSVMAVPSLAAGEGFAYSSDGTTYLSVTTLEEAVNSVGNNGYVKLLKDVIISSKVNVGKGITFLGNNHKITRATGFTDAFFSIEDVSGANVIRFKDMIIDGKRDNVAGSTSMIFCLNSNVELDNVKLINSYINTGDGGAVSCYGGSFAAINSSFINNRSEYGGAVFAQNSALTFDNCVLSENSAQVVGGAIAVYNSDITFINTTVTENESHSDSASTGAGVVAESCDIMFGGTSFIEGNKRVSGENRISDNLYLNGGQITLLNSFNDLSLVYITHNNVATISSYFANPQKMSSSFYSDNQGYIYQYNGSAVEVKSGNEVILNGNGTNIDRNLIYVSGTYGKLPEPLRNKFTFLGWYTKANGGVKINDYAPFTPGVNNILYAKWDPAVITYSISGKNYGAKTLAEAIDKCENNGTVLLNDDIKISETVTVNKNVTIKSAKATAISKITRANSDFKGTMFKSSSASSVKIKFENIVIDASQILASGQKNPTAYVGATRVFDIGGNSNVVLNGVTVANNFGGTLNSSVFYLHGNADVSVENGSVIKNCSAENNGSAAFLANGAKITFKDSTIDGCYSRKTGNGGAVYSNGGTVTFENSNVENCYTKYNGGVMYIDGGSLVLDNGTVIKNNYVTSSSGKGGAVYVNAGQITIKGDAVVNGNYAGDLNDEDVEPIKNNIYLKDSNAVVTVSKELSYDADLGFTTGVEYDNRVIVPNFEFEGVDSSTVIGKFACDKGGYYMPKNASSLMFCYAYKVTFDGNKSVASEPYRIIVESDLLGELPTAEDRQDFTFSGWWDSPVYGEGTEYKADSIIDKDITLYAQWKNNYALDDDPLSVIGRFFQRIAEMMRIAFQFLANLFNQSR